MSANTQLMDDSRLGRPSASSMARYFACLGAWGLEQIVAAQSTPSADLSSAAADKGTLLHEANERGDVSDLEVSDVDTVESIRNAEARLATDWATDHGFNLADCKIRREVRVWTAGGEVSAKIDTLVFSPCARFGLVIDAKTGRKKVAAPVRNWQLRTCAVAAADAYQLVSVRVAIAQPFAKEQPACEYPTDELKMARAQILRRIEQMQQADQPRTPGAHCEHCPAKLICPEARAKMSVVIRQAALNWDLVAPDQKAPLWQAATLAEQAAKLIKAQIRKDIETDAKSVPGLVKKADQKPRKITDVNAAFHVLDTELGGSVTLKEFVAECGLSMKDFLALYRSKTGATAADAERFVTLKCGKFVSEGFRSGAIELKEAA